MRLVAFDRARSRVPPHALDAVGSSLGNVVGCATCPGAHTAHNRSSKHAKTCGLTTTVANTTEGFQPLHQHSQRRATPSSH